MAKAFARRLGCENLENCFGYCLGQGLIYIFKKRKESVQYAGGLIMPQIRYSGFEPMLLYF